MGIDDCKDGPVFEIAQWFPQVRAYDDVHGWNTLPYLGQGEFYTDFGDFEVSIDALADHLVVGSGELANPTDVLTAEQYERLKKARDSADTVVIRSIEDVDQDKSAASASGWASGTTRKTWRFAAKNVRTFAWASSAAFIWDACGTTIQGHDTPSAPHALPVVLLWQARPSRLGIPKARAAAPARCLQKLHRALFQNVVWVSPTPPRPT